MKAEDIIKQLVAKLPSFTDKFCEQTAIDTITVSGLVATATVLAGHGRTDGELVTITGAVSPIEIRSIERTGTLAEVITETVHDFTMNTRDATQTVTISGTTEAEFNGVFELHSVKNRNTLTIIVDDSGPTSATGAPVLENGASVLAQFNGAFNITVLNSTQFTYTLKSEIVNDAIGTPIMHSGHRVTGSVSIERFLDAYTKQPTNDWYCVVVLGDVIASKGRQNRSDSVDRHTDNQYYKQIVTQPFGIYLVAPASDSIAGRSQRDAIEDEVPSVLKSVLLAKFPTGLTVNQHHRSIFTAHGMYLYNGPVYVHEITFEQDAEFLFEDSVGIGDHVAFRDIDLSISTDLGTEILVTNDIDLDDIEYIKLLPANLVNTNDSNSTIYVHEGSTSTITASFSSPNLLPAGLAYDDKNKNLISCDGFDNRIYLHEGTTGTITSSFAGPGLYMSGLVYADDNLISCAANSDFIYVHAGITGTITTTFASPWTAPAGLAYDGINLISCDLGEDIIRIHSGITSTILSGFSSAGNNKQGLAYDGINLISCATDTGRIYIHAGITSTITTSFLAPAGTPTGLTYSF